MRIDAPRQLACNGQLPHVEESDKPTHRVDVSAAAQDVLLYGAVSMDAEAFGVTVSRRLGAAPANLTPYERGRLLDVLCHAHAVHRRCTPEEEVTFPIWIVSSDARDAKPRAQWLVLSHLDAGGLLIRLSDL